jgi:hypothetical protein
MAGGITFGREFCNMYLSYDKVVSLCCSRRRFRVAEFLPIAIQESN